MLFSRLQKVNRPVSGLFWANGGGNRVFSSLNVIECERNSICSTPAFSNVFTGPHTTIGSSTIKEAKQVLCLFPSFSHKRVKDKMRFGCAVHGCDMLTSPATKGFHLAHGNPPLKTKQGDGPFAISHTISAVVSQRTLRVGCLWFPLKPTQKGERLQLIQPSLPPTLSPMAQAPRAQLLGPGSFGVERAKGKRSPCPAYLGDTSC